MRANLGFFFSSICPLAMAANRKLMAMVASPTGMRHEISSASTPGMATRARDCMTGRILGGAGWLAVGLVWSVMVIEI